MGSLTGRGAVSSENIWLTSWPLRRHRWYMVKMYVSMGGRRWVAYQFTSQQSRAERACSWWVKYRFRMTTKDSQVLRGRRKWFCFELGPKSRRLNVSTNKAKHMYSRNTQKGHRRFAGRSAKEVDKKVRLRYDRADGKRERA